MNLFKQACIACVCLISACAAPKRVVLELPTQPQKVTPLVEQKHKIELEHKIPQKSSAAISPSSLTSWELSGAMAARSQKKGWTASLNWLQQGPNQYQIRLFGPLGGGTVIIEKQGSQITYRDGPKKISSGNADALLQKETGVRLPVKNLYYWVRGLPAPGSVQSAQHDADNRLLLLKQAGYTINYTGYTSAGGMNLPSKIRLQGNGVMIKLVIKHWKV